MLEAEQGGVGLEVKEIVGVRLMVVYQRLFDLL
jgi:hypothetical protein